MRLAALLSSALAQKSSGVRGTDEAILKDLAKYQPASHRAPRLDTPLDALNLNEFQVMDLLPSLGYDAASRLLDLVAQVAFPSAVPATTLLRPVLSTGVPAFDNALAGGFQVGQVIELVGKAGMGKTQWCTTMAAREAMADNGVIYVDTEGKFSAQRLVQILVALGGTQDQAARVQVVKADGKTASQMMDLLLSLEAPILRDGVSLLVCDSVAANVRAEFASDKLLERQQALIKLAAQLKYYAESFAMTVLVTNQVMSAASGGQRPADVGRIDDPGNLVAALGAGWAYSVNVRIALESGPVSRMMRVVKSPLCKETSVGYTISACGVVPSKDALAFDALEGLTEEDLAGHF